MDIKNLDRIIKLSEKRKELIDKRESLDQWVVKENKVLCFKYDNGDCLSPNAPNILEKEDVNLMHKIIGICYKFYADDLADTERQIRELN